MRHDTNVTPNTGGTFGRSSISSAGPRIRSAAATAKQALLAMAATHLGVPVASLSVSKGVVSGGGKTVTYGALIGDKLFNVSMDPEHQPGRGAVEGDQRVLAGRGSRRCRAWTSRPR